MKETVIYNRTSTEDQNPENQLKDCKQLARDLGVEDYDIFEEQKSAWKEEEREVFNKILQSIRKKEVKKLIIWDFDRLYRNRKKTMDFIRNYGKLGLKVHSFRQKWLEEINDIPSPWNEIMYDLMLQLVSWMAEDESQKKSERIRAAIRKTNRGKTVSYRGKIWGRKEIPLKIKKEILKLHEQGATYKEITQKIFYWDKSNNKKYVSKGFVHKTIKEFSTIKISNNQGQKPTD